MNPRGIAIIVAVSTTCYQDVFACPKLVEKLFNGVLTNCYIVATCYKLF